MAVLPNLREGGSYAQSAAGLSQEPRRGPSGSAAPHLSDGRRSRHTPHAPPKPVYVMVLAARPAPVHGTFSRPGAPFNARMWEPSTAAREKSRAFAPRNSASRTSCSRDQTPAWAHSARRRQQVMPDPKPSSCGRCSQAIPVCSTNRMPWNTSWSGCARDAGVVAPPWAAEKTSLNNCGGRPRPTSSADLGRKSPHPDQ